MNLKLWLSEQIFLCISQHMRLSELFDERFLILRIYYVLQVCQELALKTLFRCFNSQVFQRRFLFFARFNCIPASFCTFNTQSSFLILWSIEMATVNKAIQICLSVQVSEFTKNGTELLKCDFYNCIKLI